jgi:anti-sigma factor RsiW
MSVEHITEYELNAFVDGQLDATDRLAVQEYLAHHPDLAARVMADLGARDSLRLALPAPAPMRPETIAVARRLQQELKLRRYIAPLRRLAAGLLIFGLGWTASSGWDRAANPHMSEAPAPVSTASVATPASEPGAAPPSAGAIIDVSHLDPAKLGAAMSVKLPRVPAGWQVVGTRIVDSDEGAGVEVMLDTPEFGRLSLFARHTNDVAIILPTVDKSKTEATAYWQLVSDSYALTGHLPRQPLEFAALELFQTLY